MRDVVDQIDVWSIMNSGNPKPAVLSSFSFSSPSPSQLKSQLLSTTPVGKSVAIGSTSAVKFLAVKSVLGDSHVFHQVQFSSAVSEQPVGLAEILEGALYRAQRARELMPDCCMWIGIENGIFNLNFNAVPIDFNDTNWKIGWKDTAAVVVISVSPEHPFGQTVTVWSDNIEVPPSQIIPTECGKRLQNWSASKDPHKEVSGRSRVEFIAEALKKAMLKIYD